jgi:hypothetical protein
MEGDMKNTSGIGYDGGQTSDVEIGGGSGTVDGGGGIGGGKSRGTGGGGAKIDGGGLTGDGSGLDNESESDVADHGRRRG